MFAESTAKSILEALLKEKAELAYDYMTLSQVAEGRSEEERLIELQGKMEGLEIAIEIVAQWIS
jgi:hypothetical protein